MAFFFSLVPWDVTVLKQLQKLNTVETLLVVNSGTGLAHVSCIRCPGLLISVWSRVLLFDMLHCLLISQEQWRGGEGGTPQVSNFAHSLTGVAALLVCFVMHHSAHEKKFTRLQTDVMKPHSVSPVWHGSTSVHSRSVFQVVVAGYQLNCLHTRKDQTTYIYPVSCQISLDFSPDMIISSCGQGSYSWGLLSYHQPTWCSHKHNSSVNTS